MFKHANIGELLFCVCIVLCCFICQSIGKSISYNVYSRANVTYIYPMQFVCNYVVGPITLLFIDYFINRLKIGRILYIGLFQAYSFLLGALVVSYCAEHIEDGYQICDHQIPTIFIAIMTLIGGSTGCFFFIGYPIYVNSIANDQNKTLFFGLAYSVYLSSTLFGNSIGYLIASQFTQFHFYLLLICLLTAIQPLLLFVKDRRANLDKSVSIRDQQQRIFKVFQDSSFVQFMPYFLMVSVIQCAYFNLDPTLLRLVLGKPVDSEISLMYIYSGLGSALGGIIVGKIGERASVLLSAWWQNILAFVYLIVCIIAFIIDSEYLTFCAAFLIGMYMAGGDTIQVTIIGKLVNDQNQYFIANNMLQVQINIQKCAGYGIAAVIYLILDRADFKYYLGTFTIELFGIVLSLIVAQRRSRSVKLPEENQII